MKGGYKILDLKGHNFTVGGAKIKIDDIYNAVEASYGKLLVIENYLIAGVEKNARTLQIGVDNGAFVSIVGLDATLSYGLYIKIEADDNVSFYQM